MQNARQLLQECSDYQLALMDRTIKATINPDRHYAPRGSAARTLFNTDRELVVSGPAGTGKSRACLEKLHYCCNHYPFTRALIVRQTRASLSETGLETFENHVLGQMHPIALDGPKRPWRSSYRYPNGSQINVGGMDRPARILSSEYDVIYWQQAEEGTLWGYETILTRLRGTALPFRQLLSDCNPESPMHWIKQRCDAGAATLFDTDHRDNPILWDNDRGEWTEFGQEYIETLNRLTGARKLRLRFGLWVVPEGAIYSLFDEERHKVAGFKPPALWPRIVAIDPVGAMIGALWMAYDPEGRILNVYREYLQPYGDPTSVHVKNILRLSQGETVFAWVGGGPSERQARTDWQANGIPLLEPPVIGVWSQIDRVIELLRDFKIVIHDSCPQLLSDIGSYRRKVVNGQPTDAIQDKDVFHLADCLRYGVAFLAEPKERVEVVDRLASIGANF